LPQIKPFQWVIGSFKLYVVTKNTHNFSNAAVFRKHRYKYLLKLKIVIIV